MVGMAAGEMEVRAAVGRPVGVKAVHWVVDEAEVKEMARGEAVPFSSRCENPVGPRCSQRTSSEDQTL